LQQHNLPKVEKQETHLKMTHQQHYIRHSSSGRR